MTNDGKPIYCWDASVFLAWINEEPGAPLADIAQMVEEIDNNQVVLVVPVTIASEVLRAKMTPDQAARFDGFLQRTNVVVAATTFAIAQKAGDIRDAGHAAKPMRKVKTPDATIIATAIIYQCDVLHSLDDRGGGPLRLNGSPIVDGLRIERPKPFARS